MRGRYALTQPTPPAADAADAAAARLRRSDVRILCLIITQPRNYATKALAVNNTWARRCNAHFFVGTAATGIDIPLLKLPVPEGRKSLWQKTWRSLAMLSSRWRLGDFDFVLKADDDTYVVMENLRHLLRGMDPNQPTVTGRQLVLPTSRSRSELLFMSGGAGYVLSRAAVRLFLLRALRPGGCKLNSTGAEDLVMAACLKSIGVRQIDSRDARWRERFHPEDASVMVGDQPTPGWLLNMSPHSFRACAACISTRSVSFHYTQNMYTLEYLVYHLRTSGGD